MGDPDRALIDQALGGDRAAMKALVALLTPTIQARVSRKLWQRGRDARQEMPDFTQEVFLALLDNQGKALRAWDPARGLTLKSFVGLLTERQIVSILRSGRRSPFREEPTDPGDFMDQHATAETEPQIESREQLAQLWDTLVLKLSTQGLEMFHRLFIECQSPDVIQQQLGMNADAVYAWRSRLRRLVVKLAQELNAGPASSSRMSSGAGSAP